jgi:hypothetical protein
MIQTKKIQATERGMRIDACKMDVETVGDFACFFKKNGDGHKLLRPEDLTLDLSVKGPQSKTNSKSSESSTMIIGLITE